MGSFSETLNDPPVVHGTRKTVPHRASVHSKERFWWRDFCAAPISKVESHIPDRRLGQLSGMVVKTAFIFPTSNWR